MRIRRIGQRIMQGQEKRPNGEQLLTKKDVARRAKCSERTVGYWMETGLFPYIKFGRGVRFTEADYEAFIRSRRIGGSK
jgi:excisionase family DNA binding protein